MDASKQDKLDTALGSTWVREFAATTGADTTAFQVVPFGSNLRVEQIPDDATARMLAHHIKTKHNVATYVYPPMDHGWEVVILSK